MPQIQANNVALFYEEKGSGPEVMLFSHGYLMDHTMYDHQVEAFKDRFRCIAYDQRGHGRSEAITSSYDVDALVNDAIGLIEALKIGPVHFVGMSTGGFVGLRLALRRPDLLKSLVLIDTSAWMVGDYPTKGAMMVPGFVWVIFGMPAVFIGYKLIRKTRPGKAAEHAMVGAAIAAVPAGGQLVLGNSLPVRVADEIAAGGRDLAVFTQRGAAGIDGLVAGAAGAAARGGATVLVLGDVSFAHDVGALACARGLPLAIVVIDNGGGRIFDQLPVAGCDLPDGAFERLWRTPPALDPVAAARAFGLDAALVRDPDEMAAAIDRSLGRGTGRGAAGPIVIHAPVAPESAATIRSAVTAALAAPASGRSPQRSHA